MTSRSMPTTNVITPNFMSDRSISMSRLRCNNLVMLLVKATIDPKGLESLGPATLEHWTIACTFLTMLLHLICCKVGF